MSILFWSAIAFLLIALWGLWSAIIIQLNRALVGTRFEKLVHRLHAWAMEVNSAIAAGLLVPWALVSHSLGPYGNLHGRPILLVNGYLSFAYTWNYLRRKLVKAGFGPIYTINVGTGRSIKTYANRLHEKVKEIQKQTGRNDLILIGHSKGGLVNAYYATHFASEAGVKITDVVSIASPLAGTPLACLAIGHDAYEMRMNSEFHQELRQRIEEHSEIRFSYIASEVDEVVPLSSALLGKNQQQQLVLNDIGHLGLIFSPRVADQICGWLL